VTKLELSDDDTMQDRIDKVSAIMPSIANGGFAFGINLHNFNPQVQHTTFPKEFVKKYTSIRYSVLDPVFVWAMVHSGSARWSEIQSMAIYKFWPKEVQRVAASHGLKYGAIVSRKPFSRQPHRSLLTAARSDREFEDEEIRTLEYFLDQIQESVTTLGPMTKLEQKVLSKLASGASQDEVAKALGVSRSSVARMIQSTQQKFGTKNQTSTVAKAAELGLLLGENDGARW